ncbi:hypothetical protein TWF481_005432 [Arthrobotrys musiformis]|uniref:Probable aspartic-type endopeptidase OPSB n=1 Tax=Arthrobotrys musiformis TaxID=47236 RepID=A0AAV9WEF5_9PEZI
MRSWLLALPLLLSSGVSSTLFARDGSSSKVIRVPFSKERAAHSQYNKREPASKTATQKLDNKDFLFYANVTVGTPPQHIRLHIDTGSSDIWVETATSEICRRDGGGSCDIGGTYDNGTSSTAEYVEGEFSIMYVDGQYASGVYAKDTLGIGGVGVKDVQFGIGLKGTSEEGVLGIGFESRQSRVSAGLDPYPGLVTQMVNQELINSRAYSVWLNDLNAAAGEILFGGIDTGKFKGPLATIPLSRRTDLPSPIDFIITLHGLTIENGEGETRELMNTSRSVPALLDTGASFTYLPQDIADQLIELVGAVTVPEYKGPAVNCSKRSLEGSVNFVFAGATIEVNLRDFIIDATDEPNEDNHILCYFGILGMSEGSVLTLGDTFLRSAYVVYDMDNEAISIAQTIFNSTSTNIMEIGSGPDAVPSATRSSTDVDSIPVTATASSGSTSSDTAVKSTGSPNVSSSGATKLSIAPTNFLTRFLVSILSLAILL